MVEPQGRYCSRYQRLSTLLVITLLIAEVPAEPIAEICGKGSCRHRRNRAIMPRNDRATQHLLRNATEIVPKQCMHSGFQKLQAETRNIPLNQHPKRRKNEPPWVRNVSASALHFIQVHRKGICFRQGKVDVQEIHCLLQCLHYQCTLSTYC